MLPTNYRNDVLNTSVNEKRRYRIISNADETVSFDEVTSYTQEGTAFGASDINATNTKVNELDGNLTASDGLGFRFATDGEGNYGYLKADDSFTPFKSKITRVELLNTTGYGTKTVDVKKYKGWEKFTDENFCAYVTVRSAVFACITNLLSSLIEPSNGAMKSPEAYSGIV